MSHDCDLNPCRCFSAAEPAVPASAETARPASFELPYRESILEEAIRITSGPRQRDYDRALPNHERIAKLWNAYLEIRQDPAGPVSPLGNRSRPGEQ